MINQQLRDDIINWVKVIIKEHADHVVRAADALVQEKNYTFWVAIDIAHRVKYFGGNVPAMRETAAQKGPFNVFGLEKFSQCQRDFLVTVADALDKTTK